LVKFQPTQFAINKKGRIVDRYQSFFIHGLLLRNLFPPHPLLHPYLTRKRQPTVLCYKSVTISASHTHNCYGSDWSSKRGSDRLQRAQSRPHRYAGPTEICLVESVAYDTRGSPDSRSPRRGDPACCSIRSQSRLLPVRSGNKKKSR